ncbi:MAG: aspartyl protease family protein [Candidatus Eremiobacteraeota bacterium]|nr:aspartyl protease family protein [Candidatus Eremiobacteraeota bacterium]
MRVRVFAVALFLFATPVLVFADDYTAADLPQDAILKKIADAAGRYQSDAYRTTIDSDGHGVKAQRVTIRHGDDYKTVESMTGGFTSAWGSYAANDWSMDQNGVVFGQIKAGELQSAMERVDDSKYMKVLGISAQSGCLDIDVNPPHGEHSVRCYDPKTYLLRKVTTWGHDRHKHVATYEDYRTTYGAQVAYTRRYGDGRPENDTTDRVVSVEKLSTIPDLVPPRSKPLFLLVGAPLALPATFAPNGHILVRVQIGTRGLDFVLDTGSSNIVLDPGVAHDLGIVPVGQFGESIGGDYHIALGRVPEMRIGGISMHDVAVDLAPVSFEAGGEKEVGLLGRDFLASNIVEIDYKNKMVFVWPRDKFAQASQGVDPVTADFSGDSPSIEASFEGVKGKFLFDTGAAFSMIYRPYLETLPTHNPNGNHVTGMFVGGEVDMTGYTLRELVLGPILFHNADVWVPTSSTAVIDGYDGILGRDILSAYRVFIDYQSAKLYLVLNN